MHLVNKEKKANKNFLCNIVGLCVIYLWLLASLVKKSFSFFNKIYVTFDQDPEGFLICILGLIGIIFAVLFFLIKDLPVKKTLKIILIVLIMYLIALFVLGYVADTEILQQILGVKNQQFKHMKFEGAL